MKLGYMPDGTGQAFPFDKLFTQHVNVMKHGIEDINALVLWGGEDISATYYKEKAHPYTQNSGGPSRRDQNEWRAMQYAKWNNIPIIGVCRGAQFLCVFSGGKLIQHVQNHHSTHNVTTSDGRSMSTSSCHHQMMYPFNTKHKMLAWTSNNRSAIYEDGNSNQIKDMEVRVEPEVVFFPESLGLAIQGHPEWMNSNDTFVHYCLELVEKHLLCTAIEQE